MKAKLHTTLYYKSIGRIFISGSQGTSGLLSNIYPSNIKLANEEKQLQKTLYL